MAAGAYEIFEAQAEISEPELRRARCRFRAAAEPVFGESSLEWRERGNEFQMLQWTT